MYMMVIVNVMVNSLKYFQFKAGQKQYANCLFEIKLMGTLWSSVLFGVLWLILLYLLQRRMLIAAARGQQQC